MSNLAQTYTVVEGDTLSGIALKFFKNPNRWYSIWVLNLKQVPNPDHIRPGQVLVITDSTTANRADWDESKIRIPFRHLFDCVEVQRNEIRDLVQMLTKLRDEYKKLPHSLGYEFTHMPEVDAKLLEYGISIPEKQL